MKRQQDVGVESEQTYSFMIVAEMPPREDDTGCSLAPSNAAQSKRRVGQGTRRGHHC